MDILRLRCFIALAEYLSFTNAAEALHISQSSMSKHIMQLERELEAPLFERKGRSTKLTEVGASVVVYIKNIVTEYDSMMKTVAGFVDNETRVTRLGIAPMGCQNKLVKTMKAIISKHSNKSLKIVEREEFDLLSEVTHGNLDMIVIRKEILPLSGFRTYKILREGALVILSHNHPLSGHEYLNYDLVKNENYIFMEEFTAPHKIFLEAFRAAGVEPNIVRVVKTEIIMLNCVIDGEGICLFFESDTGLYHYITDIKMIPLKEDVHSEIVLAVPNWKKITPVERILSNGLKDAS